MVEASERFHSLDLSRAAGEGFAISPGQAPWGDLPWGAQIFGGIPFRVEGKLQVTGMEAVVAS